jgi:hypothetical protein
MAVTLEQIKVLLEQAIRGAVGSLQHSPSRGARERRYRPKLKDDGIHRDGKNGGHWNDNDGTLAEDEEAIYWRKRFEELKTSTTGTNVNPALLELESDLGDAQKREDSAEQLCRELEKKIERLQSPSTSRRALQEVLIERVEDRRLTLEFMEWLTCMSVKHNVMELGQDEFICTAKNPREKKVTRFSIMRELSEEDEIARAGEHDAAERMDAEVDIAGDEDGSPKARMMRYEPRANIEELPDYLRQAIRFDTDMAPVLLLDVLNAMYGEAEEEESVVVNPNFRGTGIGLGETEER